MRVDGGNELSGLRSAIAQHAFWGLVSFTTVPVPGCIVPHPAPPYLNATVAVLYHNASCPQRAAGRRQAHAATLQTCTTLLTLLMAAPPMQSPLQPAWDIISRLLKTLNPAE